MFEWITDVLARGGYGGLFLLAFLENVFPPIPSEVLMPLAGFLAARGEMELGPAIASASLGSLAGALLWYYVGRWLGLDRMRRLAGRHGRWLAMAPSEVDGVAAWFLRHGPPAVLLGRVTPGLRTMISVPAGIFAMPLAPFLAYTLVGTVAWTTLLTWAGFLLEEAFLRVGEWLDPLSALVTALLLAWYLHRVLTWPAPGVHSPSTSRQHRQHPFTKV